MACVTRRSPGRSEGQQPVLAIREYHKCERFWGPNAEIVANLAQAHLMQNLLAPTDSLLDYAAALDPKMARVHFVRGMVRRMQGRGPEARSEFQTYLNLDPTGMFAQAARQFLRQMGS